MSIFKCKMCGGTIEFEPGATVGVCDSCGTRQTLPRLDDDKKTNLYDRANHFRRNNDFDKAMAIYEQILNEDNTDAEAYWSLVLCRYGIEYVEDPQSHKRIPTVNRAQFTSVFADEDYKSALQYADSYQRSIYEEEARAIDDIQKGILAISQREEPFDIFICYKETDANGRRTQDSVLATDLYHQLTQEGFKVFFSRITLEDKLGIAYEPYIFAALNSAKVMVALGTKPEYFNAVWVKNEWSRYLALVKKSGGKKVLIPAYRDMDPYDLPEEFSHLQAQDMSKLGFMQDLIRGIKKITAATDTPTATIKETIVSDSTVHIAPLLKRAFMFLEDGNWEEADAYCEKVLDQDPENAQAYLGKLMAELRVRRQEELQNCQQPFNSNNNYRKAVRFGGDRMSSVLNGYITHINERNENARLTGIYYIAVNAMSAANSETEFKSIAETFRTIPGFKDADSLAGQCLDKAEIYRKDAIYSSGKSQMTGKAVSNYEAAINTFRTISGWKDADEQIAACQRKIEEIKAANAKAESDRLKRLLAREEKKRKAKRIAKIVTPIVACATAFFILLGTVIIPTSKYNAAMKLKDTGKYTEAINAFRALNGYRDSAAQIENCIKDEKYNAALDLFNNRKYTEAISAFQSLDGYRDSAALIEKSNTAIKDEEYNAALTLFNNRKYTEAISAFQSLDGYRDSAALIEKSNTAIKDEEYNAALTLFNNRKYTEAISAFQALDGYKDSKAQIEKCNTAIKDRDYNIALTFYNGGQYTEAISIFQALNGYKDSEALIEKCIKAEALKNPKVGDTIYWGAYEQDNDTSNGKEDIEWLVLAIDGNKALVISKYALDWQEYNAYRADVTWKKCSLRTWMNGTFLNSAFSADEQAKILSAAVLADENPKYSTDPGNATTDKMFLLSITEAEKYFTTDASRKCTPTDYAKAQGAYASSSDSSCRWWLRSPGLNQHKAADVDLIGSIDRIGFDVCYDFCCVRPAMWIDLDA